MQKTIGTEVLFKGYIQNPTVDHFIDHIQVKLSWSTLAILGGLSRPWSPDQGYEYCLLRSNSSSKSPKGDQDPCVDVRSSKLLTDWIIWWTYLHLWDTCGMNKSKVAAISLSTKTGREARHLGHLDVRHGGGMHDASQQVRFMWLWLCPTMPNILHERARNVRNVGKCKTIFMQKCPEDVDFAIQRWAPSSSIHEKDNIYDTTRTRKEAQQKAAASSISKKRFKTHIN